MFWKKKLSKKLIKNTSSRKTIKYSKVKTLNKLLDKIKTKLDKLDNNNEKSNKLIVLSCKIPVNKLKGKIFIKDKPYLCWIAVRKNDVIKSLYKYRLSKYKGKLDYEMKIYKLDDVRIKELMENKFNNGHILN
jgi:hypothetical protein